VEEPVVDEIMTSSIEQFVLDRDPNRACIIGGVAQGHDGSLGMAHAFIDVIADAACNAVKFQTRITAAETNPRTLGGGMGDGASRLRAWLRKMNWNVW